MGSSTSKSLAETFTTDPDWIHDPPVPDKDKKNFLLKIQNGLTVGRPVHLTVLGKKIRAGGTHIVTVSFLPLPKTPNTASAFYILQPETGKVCFPDGRPADNIDFFRDFSFPIDSLPKDANGDALLSIPLRDPHDATYSLAGSSRLYFTVGTKPKLERLQNVFTGGPTPTNIVTKVSENREDPKITMVNVTVTPQHPPEATPTIVDAPATAAKTQTPSSINAVPPPEFIAFVATTVTAESTTVNCQYTGPNGGADHNFLVTVTDGKVSVNKGTNAPFDLTPGKSEVFTLYDHKDPKDTKAWALLSKNKTCKVLIYKVNAPDDQGRSDDAPVVVDIDFSKNGEFITTVTNKTLKKERNSLTVATLKANKDGTYLHQVEVTGYNSANKVVKTTVSSDGTSVTTGAGKDTTFECTFGELQYIPQSGPGPWETRYDFIEINGAMADEGIAFVNTTNVDFFSLGVSVKGNTTAKDKDNKPVVEAFGIDMTKDPVGRKPVKKLKEELESLNSAGGIYQGHSVHTTDNKWVRFLSPCSVHPPDPSPDDWNAEITADLSGFVKDKTKMEFTYGGTHYQQDSETTEDLLCFSGAHQTYKFHKNQLTTVSAIKAEGALAADDPVDVVKNNLCKYLAAAINRGYFGDLNETHGFAHPENYYPDPTQKRAPNGLPCDNRYAAILHKYFLRGACYGFSFDDVQPESKPKTAPAIGRCTSATVALFDEGSEWPKKPLMWEEALQSVSVPSLSPSDLLCCCCSSDQDGQSK